MESNACVASITLLGPHGSLEHYDAVSYEWISPNSGAIRLTLGDGRCVVIHPGCLSLIVTETPESG